MKTPHIIYVCVHNAGRSQMAEAFTRELAKERGLSVTAASAGTVGGKNLNPMAVAAMSELGIDMTEQSPKLLTPEMVEQSTRIISMGCGVDAEACPTKFLLSEDWELEDPAGQPLEKVREIRDEIRRRVENMLRDFEGQ